MSGTTDRPSGNQSVSGGPEDGLAPPAGERFDDAAIGALVRDVAEGWTMPPQRLGQATWRDRIRRRGVSRVTGGWSRRLGAAATTAIAATIILAFGAVWLTQPGRGPATGQVGTPAPTTGSTPYDPSPRASGTPVPSLGPSPSPLPAYALSGDPLPVKSLMLVGGGYRVLDLTTGRLGDELRPGAIGFGERMLPAADGGWTCVCATYADESASATSVSVELVDFDSTGSLTGRRFINTYDGAIGDPQVEYFWHPASVQVTRSDRPDRAYVGWSIRTADGWQAGVDVIDLVAAKVVEKVHLPLYPLVDGTDAGQKPILTVAQAPTVRVSPSGTRIAIAQQRGDITHNAYGVSTDVAWSRSGHWMANVDGDRVSDPVAMADGPGTLDPRYCTYPIDEGFASEDVYAVVCSSPGVLRRVDVTGAPLGDVAIDGTDGGFVSVVTGPDGSRYVWMAFSRKLVKIDPIAGKVVAETTIARPTASAGDGPLDGLAALGRQVGRWLAPTTVAKVFLDPAMAISPDGSRLYLLGVDADTFTDASAGSTGIDVVDTSNLAEVANWAPLADYDSIAVSGDGSLVYVTSIPQFADGGSTIADASLTVYDAATGQPRLIAGQLVSDFISLDPALVP